MFVAINQVASMEVVAVGETREDAVRQAIDKLAAKNASFDEIGIVSGPLRPGEAIDLDSLQENPGGGFIIHRHPMTAELPPSLWGPIGVDWQKQWPDWRDMDSLACGPGLSDSQVNFFFVEIRNERFGGASPATLDSAIESLIQAPLDVIEDWCETDIVQAKNPQSVIDFIESIKGLAKEYGRDKKLEDLLPKSSLEAS